MKTTDFISIKKLDLSNSGLEEFPEFIKNYKDIHYLNLSKNEIKEFPNYIKEMNLKYLDIQGNPLEGSIDLSDTSLESLYISFTSISEVKLPNTILDFQASNTNIKEIPYGVSKLQVLEMSNCGLKRIEDKISSFGDLTHLVLENNSIEYVSNKISELDKLRVLNLSENNITDVSFLVGMESLEFIYLD